MAVLVVSANSARGNLSHKKFADRLLRKTTAECSQPEPIFSGFI
jgi:hypothetical protein